MKMKNENKILNFKKKVYMKTRAENLTTLSLLNKAEILIFFYFHVHAEEKVNKDSQASTWCSD